MKITTCRVKENTKKKIQFLTNVISVKEEIENENKSKNYSEDDIINISLDKTIESMGIEVKENISEGYIIGTDNFLKSKRIDNNFKPKNKRILKSLGEVMFDEGVVKKKLNYDEVLTILIGSYIERFPNFKKCTFTEKYIDMEFRLNEGKKSKLY